MVHSSLIGFSTNIREVQDFDSHRKKGCPCSIESLDTCQSAAEMFPSGSGFLVYCLLFHILPFTKGLSKLEVAGSLTSRATLCAGCTKGPPPPNCAPTWVPLHFMPVPPRPQLLRHAPNLPLSSQAHAPTPWSLQQR